MNPQLLNVFQYQVLSQCEYMLMADDDLTAALADRGTRSASKAFYALQNMLNAAANVSKALWGQADSLAAERKPLRDSIEVTDDSPLHAVKMRNNFEHFDERLDKWWLKSKEHRYFDSNVFSRSDFMTESIDWFRLFNFNTRILYFWGQEFNIQAILDEARRIVPLLEKANREYPILEWKRRLAAEASGTPPHEAKEE